MRAICIGECMVELRETGAGLYSRSFAGDVYNTAVYLKRSAPEVEISFLTATGAGALDRAMRSAWAAEGIDEDLAFSVRGAAPGLYLIELDPFGERTFQYWRSSSAARSWLSKLACAGGADLLVGADLIFLSGISLAILSPTDRADAIKLIQSLKGRVGMIGFDANIRPSLWDDAETAQAAVAPIIQAADFVRASREDAAWLYGSRPDRAQIASLATSGAREVVLTLGADGCILCAGGRQRIIASPAAVALDTSGAGDSFNGAYLGGRLRGSDAVSAALEALRVASRVVTFPGAIAPGDVSHPHASSQ